MSLRRFRIAAASLATLLLVLPAALAQDPGGAPPSQPPPPMQPPGRHGAPGIMRNPGRSLALMPPAYVLRLLEAVDLDAAQKQQIEGIVKDVNDRTRQKMQQVRTDSDLMNKMPKIREDMRQAREANDQNRLQQLREEMQKLMQPQWDLQAEADREMHDAIKPVLRPEQLEEFEHSWTDAKSGRLAPMTGGRVRTLRDLRRVVLTLGLNKEQQEAVNGVFESYRKQRRDAANPADEEKLVAEARSQIEQHLNDSQKQMLERRLNPPQPHGRPPMPGSPGAPTTQPIGASGGAMPPPADPTRPPQ